MTRPLPRDLRDLARDSGYAATPCPSCAHVPPSGQHGCGNCGGSARLWTSPRGSLSDDGLLRLARLLGRDATDPRPRARRS